jgi:hypothetical protein
VARLVLVQPETGGNGSLSEAAEPTATPQVEAAVPGREEGSQRSPGRARCTPAFAVAARAATTASIVFADWMGLQVGWVLVSGSAALARQLLADLDQLWTGCVLSRRDERSIWLFDAFFFFLLPIAP